MPFTLVQKSACVKFPLEQLSNAYYQVTFVNLDDVSLVEKIQEGHKAAFVVLLERWQHKVYTQCYQQLHNSLLAEEATQEIFIKVYKGLDNFQYKAKFSTWLFRIVVNHCTNVREYQYRRKKELHEPLEGTNLDFPREIESKGLGPQKSLEKQELKDMIHQSLAQLTDQQRDILILRDIQEFSYDEIAQILDITVGTVKSRVHRAREALKPILLRLMRR
jgi:RNA polymerase sigma-70 factor, ECF subfamily